MTREPETTRLLDMRANELRNLEAQLQASGMTAAEALALLNGGLLGRWVEAGRQLLSGVEPVTTFVTTRCEYTAGDTCTIVRLAGGVHINWIHNLRYTDEIEVTWPDDSSSKFDLTPQWQRITRPDDSVQVEIRACDRRHERVHFGYCRSHLRIREIHRIAAPEPLRVAIPLDDIRAVGGTQVEIGTASVCFDGWTSGGDIILDALRWPLNPTRHHVVLLANEVVGIARGVEAYFDVNDLIVYVTDRNQYADTDD